MSIGKVLKDNWAVIADGSQLNSLLFKALFRVLQLDQLRFTEGSPVSGAEEEENCAARPPQAFVGLPLTKLIGG